MKRIFDKVLFLKSIIDHNDNDDRILGFCFWYIKKLTRTIFVTKMYMIVIIIAAYLIQ